MMQLVAYRGLHFWRYVVALVMFFSVSFLAEAIDVPNTPTNGYVLDQTNTLSGESQAWLNQVISNVKKQTTAEMAVLVVPSLQGIDVHDYALSVLRTWGIGSAGKNNGVLLLLAKEEKKVRIEVGYGLEGALNDAKAGEILDKYGVPQFQKGDFEVGILDTTWL